MSQELIAGLDIGSRYVRMAAGQLVLKGEKEQLHILGACEVPSQGMDSRGNIVNPEDLVSAISMCRERLERLIHAPVEKAWVSINSSHLLCQVSKGLVGVARPNREISPDDVERATLQARTVATPSNYEILHVIPRGYSVDGQMAVKDPVGMTGIRLEVDALLIQVPATHMKNLTKLVHRTRLNIEDIVLCVIANADIVLTPRQKEVGAAVINIGASATSIAVFEEGDLLYASVLPIGADHITRDINLCFKTSLDVAERLKLKYGSANSRSISKKDEINLAEEGLAEDEIISRRALAEIIEARAEEIFSKVNAEFKKIGRAGILSAGAILCGGGANLDGIVEIAKRELRLPVCIGCPLGISSVSEKINDPAFGTVIGLVKLGSETQGFSVGGLWDNIRGALIKYCDSLKKLLKSIWK